MLAIRQEREKAGLSIEALASAAGISARTVIRIEQNRGYEPGVQAAHRLAEALGTTVDALLATDTEEEA
jgi:transcriptional regulator with XRE-family HTH domain